MSDETITWGWRRDVDGVTRHAGMDGHDDPVEAEHLARKYAAAPGYSLVYRFPGGPWMDDITNSPPQPGDGMVSLKDDRPLREWLAERFERLDTIVNLLVGRGGQPSNATLLEQINKAKGRDGLGLDGDWLEHQFEAIDRRFERILEQIGSVHHTGNPDEVTLTLAGYAAAKQAEFERGRQQGDADRAARAQSEHDRGVAEGRASVNSAMDADYAEVRARSFEAGAKIGASEREAELLEQGWTPPESMMVTVARIEDEDAYLRGQKMGMEVARAHGEGGPTDYEVWRDALTASASNVFPINGTGEAGMLDDDRRAQIRDEAVWFYRELKAGPPPDLIDPADQDQETRAAANPADLIDGDVDHTQDPNDPTSAY